MEIPTTPVIFFKLPTAIIGPGEPIVLPKNSTQPDYEAEFAFVVGKGGYRIRASDWRKHVYGYTIVNDVSARDVQFASTQWSMSKCFPTFCPLGPAIVTADEIADPTALGMWLEVNGRRFQDGSTATMVYKPAFLVSYVSRFMSLQPGDIIATGTPPGVGMGQKPPIYLKAGDVMELGIEGLGRQRQQVCAPIQRVLET